MINANLLTCEKPLQVKVESIGATKARLVFSDHQSVEVAAKFLPPEAKEGMFLCLNLLKQGDLAKSKKEVAKELLSEILKDK